MAAPEGFEFAIERGKIHEFALAVTDDNPLFHDEAIARAKGFASVLAPPTYAMCASFFQPPGSQAIPEGLDMRYVLHGEQEFIYSRPVVAGEKLYGASKAEQSFAKEGRRGGTMTFYPIATEYRDAAGELVLTVRTVTIVTSGTVQE
ncbi:MAG: MaoC family dehydratase N-terminal domain-containing protein [Thermoflexaceae bacterium]|nr:MaoC family dehydratase N-terminal domain-containing protein [Thermoflexaceae bacterium]